MLFGKHGEVARQAAEAGCSRQAAYPHADKVQQAVADAQLPGPSREELRAENRRLTEENRPLRARLARQQRQTAEAAGRRARAALALFRPDGRLNDRAWAEAEITQACQLLPGPAWRKVGAMRTDARARTLLERLHRRLAEAEP